MIRKFGKIAVLFMLANLLGGWSLFGGASKPTEADARREIERAIAKDAQGRINLLSFSKTNGTERKLMGTKIYGLEFKAVIEFTEDCKWVIGMFGQRMGFKTAELPRSKRFNWNDFNKNINSPGVKVKQGEKHALKGAVIYELTENGWRSGGIQLALDR